MGKQQSSFYRTVGSYDFFKKNLRHEMSFLVNALNENKFTEKNYEGGFELEFFLLDKNYRPQPDNLRLLQSINQDFVVPEISKTSLEFNMPPHQLTGKALTKFQSDMINYWSICKKKAAELDYKIIPIGILNTATEKDMQLSNMSDCPRYHALTNGYKRFSKEPITINIVGQDKLILPMNSYIPGGLCCALQIHTRVGRSDFVKFYNISQIISAPLLACACNSPFFLGRKLWAETRIPLIEQASRHRAYFNDQYLQQSFLDLLQENYDHYPVLFLESLQQTAVPLTSLERIRLHNGTIYRWNRPVIDFNHDGSMHLRIEFRPMASGPTIVDMIANAALFWGLLFYYANNPASIEKALSFADVKNNFYRAAKFGLNTKLTWENNQSIPVKILLLDKLIPSAEQGLKQLHFDPEDIKHFLGIIDKRILKGLNASIWQENFMNKYNDMTELMRIYIEFQDLQIPLHEW